MIESQNHGRIVTLTQSLGLATIMSPGAYFAGVEVEVEGVGVGVVAAEVFKACTIRAKNKTNDNCMTLI
jgi:hypothetical protein